MVRVTGRIVMKRYLVLSSLLVCCALALSACTASSQVIGGPVELHSSVEAHEWQGFSHETTSEGSSFESTTTAGFVTGTVGAGLIACEGASATVGVSWASDDSGEE